MDMFQVALAAFAVVLTIGLFFYVRPGFLHEGFATVALDGETMPKCFLRDAEAQQILRELRGSLPKHSSVDVGVAHAELVLILQKVLCIDADVSGSGAGPYSTYQMPFATAHDIEPAASFVGRCVRHAIRSRDLEMAMDKFEGRGKELIAHLCKGPQRDKVMVMFHNVVARATRNIATKCMTPKASLDTPAGPRDPGYFEPSELQELGPYTIRGDYQYF